MTLIPEWMSNVHPLIVHFPVALLVVAIFADFLSLILKRYSWIRPAALWLYVFGALGTIAAYISGKQAADVVHFPAAAYSVIATHADLALYTMLFFNGYALIRLFVAWKKWDQKNVLAIILFLVAAAGSGLVQQTAEHGGELVFRYGVGTNTQPKAIESQTSNVNQSGAKIEITENGSWRWQADSRADRTFRDNFRLLIGNWKNVSLKTIEDQNGNSVLALQANGQKTSLFAFGPALNNVQIRTKVNVNKFKGRFLLEYHISSDLNYDFVAIENGQARLGRVINGAVRIFDSSPVNTDSWFVLKVVSSNGHFRGYVNDKLILHGHGQELPAGQVGFAMRGNGIVKLANLDVLSLDAEMPTMNMGGQTMSHDSPGNSSGH